MPVLKVTVTEPIKNNLIDLAAKADMSQSQVIQIILESYFNDTKAARIIFDLIYK